MLALLLATALSAPPAQAPPPAVVDGRDAVAVAVARGWPAAGLDTATPLADLPAPSSWLDADASPAVRLAARRWFVAAAAVIPPDALLGPSAASWDGLRGLLDAPAAAPLRAVLEGDGATAAAALSDPDGDGLTTLHEQLLGLDPTRRDSDGDGWWDGAPAARGAHTVPLPADDTLVCFDVAPAWGRLARLELTRVFADGDVTTTASEHDSGVVVGLDLRGDAPLVGSWATLTGDALGPNGDCASTPHATARLRDDAYARLGMPDPEDEDAHTPALRAERHALAAALVQALEAPWATMAAAHGPLEARVQVLLGDGALDVLLSPATWAKVEVPVGAVRRAIAKEDLTDLAGVVVALHALGLRGNRRLAAPAAGVALWASLSGRRVKAGALGIDGAEVAAWTAAARACPTGWAGLLDRACPPPR